MMGSTQTILHSTTSRKSFAGSEKVVHNLIEFNCFLARRSVAIGDLKDSIPKNMSLFLNVSSKMMNWEKNPG